VACGGKVCLVEPTMLRTVAGSVVCGREVFAMGSLDELIITTSILLVCYCIFSCLFCVKYLIYRRPELVGMFLFRPISL
jgi:hypothetical protein